MTYARITSYICPTFYSGVHKITMRQTTKGALKIMLLVPKNVLVVKFHIPVGRLELSVCMNGKKIVEEQVQKYVGKCKMHKTA